MAMTGKDIGHIAQAPLLHLLFELTKQHVLLERVIEQLLCLLNGLAQQLGEGFLGVRVVA
ncbi:hypothetical protein D3C87_1483950 [compost metagenome]